MQTKSPVLQSYLKIQRWSSGIAMFRNLGKYLGTKGDLSFPPPEVMGSFACLPPCVRE